MPVQKSEGKTQREAKAEAELRAAREEKVRVLRREAAAEAALARATRAARLEADGERHQQLVKERKHLQERLGAMEEQLGAIVQEQNAYIQEQSAAARATLLQLIDDNFTVESLPKDEDPDREIGTYYKLCDQLAAGQQGFWTPDLPHTSPSNKRINERIFKQLIGGNALLKRVDNGTAKDWSFESLYTERGDTVESWSSSGLPRTFEPSKRNIMKEPKGTARHTWLLTIGQKKDTGSLHAMFCSRPHFDQWYADPRAP